MRLRRHLFTAIPTWLSLLVGVILGGVLTSTFTFRLWWCSYEDLGLDRETLSIVKVNERFWTRKNSLHQFEDEECLCGEDLNKLRRSVPTRDYTTSDSILKATQKPSKSIATKPTDRTFIPEDFAEFLNPNESEARLGREVEYLSYEYTLKKQLLVAVITSEENLEAANSIYNTWGLDVSQILFFVGEECNVSSPAATGLPVIRLLGVHDVPIHSPEKTFAVMKYLYENYGDSFHWFMRTGHDLYVRGEKLEKFLMRFDPSEKVYLGRLAKDNSETLQLLSRERVCMGGPGVILSRGALMELVPHLDYCLGAIEQHNRDSRDPWTQDHVELGRCISRTLGIQCSLSAEARAYFVHETSPLSPKVLESHPDLITYHPVPDATTMEVAHLFYKREEFNVGMQTLLYLESSLNELCGEDSASCEVSICEDGLSGFKKCPNVGVVNSPPKSYASLSKNDVVPWEYFDGNSIYNDQMTSPMFYLNIHKDKRQELQIILGKVVQAGSEQLGRSLKFKKVINGYVRHNPMRGNEYIVDADFVDLRGKPFQTRVHLVRPLANNYVTISDNLKTDIPINMLVPITNVNNRFKQFMTTYENIALKGTRKVNLIVSVYGKEDVIFVNEVLETYRKKYPEAVLNAIEGEGTFSRGKALHLAMKDLHPEDLAFLCDVDMDIGPGFLDRCAKNTIHGRRVYYPEFFKLYNMDYVYRTKPKPKTISIKRTHGHWAYYSFGMLCIYKSDYDSVGGMNTHIVGWGEEDVSLFERVLKHRLEVLRVPDVGLTHRWHEKNCPSSLTEKQHKHCLSSRGENLADRIELASYIYEHGWQIRGGNSTR